MADLHWKDAPIADRKAVYEAYLLCDSFPKATWDDANEIWAECRFITIKYTFCPAGYWG